MARMLLQVAAVSSLIALAICAAVVIATAQPEQNEDAIMNILTPEVRVPPLLLNDSHLTFNCRAVLPLQWLLLVRPA